MSKIEKALSRALQERGNLQLVSLPGTAASTAAGTTLIADRIGHPETIARMAANERRLLGPDVLDRYGIIHQKCMGSPTAEYFRQLRTSIVARAKAQNSVVLVTGVKPGSGGSFVSLNLGAAFAYESQRTALVVDCNLRSPSVHRLIENPAARGLSDYLEHPETTIAEIIHPVGIARLRVIPAGRDSDLQAEHFSSERMQVLIDSVRRRYAERFVILDGPPASDTADVRILSEFADFVLVVARYAHATVTQIEKVLGALGGPKLLGIVFNDEPRVPWAR